MKRIIALILSVLTVATAMCFTVSAGKAEEEKGGLYASVLSFDNFRDDSKISNISGENVEIKTVLESRPAEVDTWEYHVFHLSISGEGLYTVDIDASSVDLSAHKAAYIVIDTNTMNWERSDLTKLSVTPIVAGGEGETAQYVEYNGVGYFRLSEPADVTGLKITALEEDYVWNLSEIFFCENEYSAKYIVDNNVLPPKAAQKGLYVKSEGMVTAFSSHDYCDYIDDAMYPAYGHAKWPNITIDENDRIYVSSQSCRSGAHPNDTVGITLMATSEDGGRTYSEPRNIFSTMHGGAAGVLYLGDGKLAGMASGGTIASYLPGGGSDVYFRNRAHGGDIDFEVAEHWDEDGYPVTGFLGVYYDVIKYFAKYDPDHCMPSTYYRLISYDYGETWNTKPYEFLDVPEVTEEMRAMADKFELIDIDGEAPMCPVGYGAHGPKVLRDGTTVVVGYEDPNMERNVPDGEAAFYASYDDCETWEFRGCIQTPCYFGQGNFFEPDVTDTLDGVLICGFRSHVIYNGFSYDGGRTWTTPAQTEIEGYPPGFTTMPNGDIVITTNWRYGVSKIYAYVSEDGGRTWSTCGTVQIVGGDGYSDMGYPNNVYLSDGKTVVTAYYTTGHTTDIATTRWTYELIDNTPNTWQKDPRGWYYLDENSEKVKNAWAKDSGGLCYLDVNGYLVTGRSLKDGKKYYLVDEVGHKVTKKGWNKVAGTWYYVEGADGSLKVNGWMKDSKGWCFLLGAGAMATNRSVKDSKGWCLVDASGYWVTGKSGWVKAGSDWYYAQTNGYLKVNGWMKDSKGWCYLDTDGRMMTNATLKDSKGWCLIDGSGYWVTATGWQKVDSDWYYVQNGGYLKTNGWMKDSKGWCYLDAYGKMLKNIVIKDSHGWCLLTPQGYWQTTPGTYYITIIKDRELPVGEYEIGSDGYIIVNK